MFQCKDLYTLTSFTKAKIIAGRQGVSNSIRWAYKVEEMEFGKWIKGRELLVVSNGITKYTEFSLYKIVQTAIKHHVAGALLMMGKGYVEEVSPQVITLANKYGFPLFTMNWNDVPLVELFEELGHAIAYQDSLERQKDDVLANILFGSYDRHNEQFLNTKVKGYGISPPYQIFALHFFTDQDEMVQEREYIVRKIMEICGTYHICVLLTKYSGNFVGLLHADPDHHMKWTGLQEDMVVFIQNEYPTWSFILGVGSPYVELKQMHKSFQEATQCITLSHKLKKRDHILLYEQLGFYNLLLQIENEEILYQYCNQILGSLMEYDKENHMELIKTLKYLLNTNCNILETSKQMFIHRNTVKYRIQRIEELTGRSLGETINKTYFQTGLMVLNYLEEDE